MKKLIGLLILTINCAFAFDHVAPDSTPSEPHAESKAQKKIDPVLYRSIFYCFAKKEKNYSDDELREMIFLPTNEMQARVGAKTTEEFYKKKSEIYAKTKPIDLYNKGVETPVSPVDCQKLEERLINNPPTVVMCPGIFGEFIDNRAFEEFFKDNVTTDTDAMISKAVVKNSKGQPLFNYLIFETKKFEFKSMGRIEDRGREFSENLDKYLKKNPELAKNIKLAGYSRGASIAYQMLAYANTLQEKPIWFNTKGTNSILSIGGTGHGSELADVALDPASATYKRLRAAQVLAKELTPLPYPNAKGGFTSVASMKNAAARTINELAWAKFIKNEAIADSPKGSFDIARETDARTVDVLGSSKIFQEMIDGFWTNDYNGDIIRWKHFIKEMKTGAEQLASESRDDFWRTNTLPENTRIYGLAGVMSQPGTKLGKSKVDYHQGSLDESIQAGSNRDLTKVANTELNDGQVTLLRTQIDPELAALLNPGQKPVDYTLLGVHGTPHWGLALRTANAGSVNPFPRKAELTAALAAMAWDEERE